MNLTEYQKKYGTPLVERALKRVENGGLANVRKYIEVKDKSGWPQLVASEEVEQDVYFVPADKKMGDLGGDIWASLTYDLPGRGFVVNLRRWDCNCDPHHKKKTCSHLLAAQFHNLMCKGDKLEIDPHADKEELKEVNEVVINIQGSDIFFTPLGYINLGNKFKWKNYFGYDVTEKRFLFKSVSFDTFSKAIDFLKQNNIETKYDEEKIKDFFKLQKEESKIVEVIEREDRVYFYFRKGFESIASFDEIRDYKKWQWQPKTDLRYDIRYVSYEGDETKKISYSKIVFSVPIGFSSLFIKYLISKGFDLTNITELPYDKIETGLNAELKLREYQADAIQKWEGNGMIGVIVAPTASGKTIIGSMIIYNTGVKTLILVHTKDLIEQWRKSLLKSLNVTESEIGIFAAGKKEIDKKIIIGTYQSFIKNMQSLRTAKFGLVISDECHHVPAKTFVNVNQSISAPFKLGLTATPNRADGKDGDIFAYYDKIVCEVEHEQLINDGHISNVVFYQIMVREPALDKIEKEFQPWEGGKKTAKTKEISSNSKVKLEVVENLIEKLDKNGKTYIVFSERIQPAKNLAEKLMIPFLTSDLTCKDREELFEKIRKGIVKGIVSARLGIEGIDIPNLDAIINIVPQKSHVSLSQKVGRAMRIRDSKHHGFYFDIVAENSEYEMKWAEESYKKFWGSKTGSKLVVRNISEIEIS